MYSLSECIFSETNLRDGIKEDLSLSHARSRSSERGPNVALSWWVKEGLFICGAPKSEEDEMKNLNVDEWRR